MDNEMRRAKSLRNYALLLMLSISPLTSHAGVYVTYDSLSPTYEQKLSQAQIEAMNALAQSSNRQAEINEYYASEFLEYMREDALRTQQESRNLEVQKMLISKAEQQNRTEANRLLQQRAALEEQRVAMLHDISKDKVAFYETQLSNQERQAETQRQQAEKFNAEKQAFYDEQAAAKQAFYQEQEQREQEFLTQQRKANDEIIAMQGKVAASHNRLIEQQFELNSPSNVVVTSKDATNLKAVTNSYSKGELKEIKRGESSIVLVNMHEFIQTIIPDDWKYLATKVLENKNIQAVSAKNWQSAINMIAVNNPDIEFIINTVEKAITPKYTSQYLKQLEQGNATSVPRYRAWQITTSKSLRKTLTDFGKEANWHVLWEAQGVDYETVAPAVIRTTFDGENGIVNQLIKSTETKKMPLFADWKRGNNVVIIRVKGATKK